MPVTATFFVRAPGYNQTLVVAQGFSDGTVIVRDGAYAIELPAELVRQLRAELESRALDRVAAYGRKRAEDCLVARDRLSMYNPHRRMFEDRAAVYREMAAKAIAEKES